MRTLFTLVFCAALTLWLGGLLALFVFVQGLFSIDRAAAGQAAPILFRVFEVYQLILLAIALPSLIGWQIVAGSKLKTWMLGLVVVAGLLAVAQTAVVSSRMRQIMAGDEAQIGEFRRLHGYSMILYTSQTVLLAAAACLLPAAIRREGAVDPRPPSTIATPATSPATDRA